MEINMPGYLFDECFLDKNEQATLFALSFLNRLSGSEKLLIDSVTKAKKNKRDFSMTLAEGLGCKIVLTRRGTLFRICAQGVRFKYGQSNHVNVGESVKSIPGACARLCHHIEAYGWTSRRELTSSIKFLVSKLEIDHKKCVPCWWERFIVNNKKQKTVFKKDFNELGTLTIFRHQIDSRYHCFGLLLSHDVVVHSDIEKLKGRKMNGANVWIGNDTLKHSKGDTRSTLNNRLTNLLLEL
jgi:hypothetical protein